MRREIGDLKTYMSIWPGHLSCIAQLILAISYNLKASSNAVKVMSYNYSLQQYAPELVQFVAKGMNLAQKLPRVSNGTAE